MLGRAEATNSGYEGSWVPANQNDRFTKNLRNELLVLEALLQVIEVRVPSRPLLLQHELEVNDRRCAVSSVVAHLEIEVLLATGAAVLGGLQRSARWPRCLTSLLLVGALLV